MSHPITSVEKVQAQQTHEMNEIRENTTNEVKQELTSMNPKYDIVGMFPPVKKLSKLPSENTKSSDCLSITPNSFLTPLLV